MRNFAFVKSGYNSPFKAYMIQHKNPLRVSASGKMNIIKMKAEADSSSSSTMPMPYNTAVKISVSDEKAYKSLPSKNEMRDPEDVAA